MRKLLVLALAAALLAAVGCHITDYPVITDDRGDFSGVIRTGHRAYVAPTSSVATIWSDGTDELINLVYQNQYGDQKLYTKNNFDPTGSVIFIDQTYCDWRFDDCEIAMSWNPVNGPDDVFDFDGYSDCAGYRSLSLLVSQGSRIGECGDVWLSSQPGDRGRNLQAVLDEFSMLPTTTFRGETAYVASLNYGNFAVNVGGVEMPVVGQQTIFFTKDLDAVVPVGPNAILQLNWLADLVSERGEQQDVQLDYNNLSTTVDVRFLLSGLLDAGQRF